ncbi:hypothetical protein SALBM135S_02567 [Streptomyces alboniger]
MPEDSLVGGGIGCHAMVLLMDEDQVGTVTGLSQMGGEGLQWIGMAPYLRREHYLQNLGDQHLRPAPARWRSGRPWPPG